MTPVSHPDKPETWETRGTVYKRLMKWAEDADWEGEYLKAASYRKMAERYRDDQHDYEVPF